MRVQENFSLRRLNTFKIDAICRFFAEFTSAAAIKDFLNTSYCKDYPLLILGGGSNILFTKNFDGTVLKNNIKGIKIVREDNNYAYVQAGAGEIWHQFVLFCITRNLGGAENLSLIPGTVGAAPVQNIGAYGAELKDIFCQLEAIDIETGQFKQFSKEECRFGYRDSFFKREGKGKYIIVSVTFCLCKSPLLNTSYGAIENELQAMGVNEPSVQTVSEAVCRIRRSKLPDPEVTGNAGSFFKNPEIPETQLEKIKKQYPAIPAYNALPGKVKIAAGWLIEQCGWKGWRKGDVGIHPAQALVLVNYGNASGHEVLELSRNIQHAVLEKFGIPLETEVNIL